MVGRQSSEASALLGWQHTCLTHLGSTEKVLAKPFSPNSLACCGPLVWNETKSTWPVIASEVPRAIGSIRTMSLKKKKYLEVLIRFYVWKKILPTPCFSSSNLC
jgi:hypothetical protein